MAEGVKYDDASWHYDGEFPKELPFEAGGTHIAMFLTWALFTDLGGDYHTEELSERLNVLRAREISPGQYLFACCDGKVTNDNLSEEGNSFAMKYYESGQYFIDYETAVGGNLSTLYHARDSWQVFDRIKPIIDKRYEAWVNEK